MGKPLTSIEVLFWDRDEESQYFGPREGSSDETIFLLAYKHGYNHIKREEEENEQDVNTVQYKLFKPNEINVESYESMKSHGWDFEPVTVEDLVKSFEIISGYHLPGWYNR